MNFHIDYYTTFSCVQLTYVTLIAGQNKTTEEICTIVNNLEYVRRSLAEYDDEHM